MGDLKKSVFLYNKAHTQMNCVLQKYKQNMKKMSKITKIPRQISANVEKYGPAKLFFPTQIVYNVIGTDGTDKIERVQLVKPFNGTRWVGQVLSPTNELLKQKRFFKVENIKRIDVIEEYQIMKVLNRKNAVTEQDASLKPAAAATVPNSVTDSNEDEKRKIPSMSEFPPTPAPKKEVTNPFDVMGRLNNIQDSVSDDEKRKIL